MVNFMLNVFTPKKKTLLLYTIFCFFLIVHIYFVKKSDSTENVNERELHINTFSLLYLLLIFWCISFYFFTYAYVVCVSVYVFVCV